MEKPQTSDTKELPQELQDMRRLLISLAKKAGHTIRCDIVIVNDRNNKYSNNRGVKPRLT